MAECLGVDCPVYGEFNADLGEGEGFPPCTAVLTAGAQAGESFEAGSCPFDETSIIDATARLVGAAGMKEAAGGEQ